MKQFGKCCRCIAVIICLIMSVLIMPVCSFASTNVEKSVTSHDIAIVYDTSGSMFDETDYWCQALYAIEVFASMLDYDNGDKLGIYPMDPNKCPIRIGKDGNDVGARLEITKDSIQDIENVYVPQTSWTIFEPVYTASDYLKSSTADEKWLIVLTDGEFNKIKARDEVSDTTLEASWIENELKKISKDSNGEIKVQYLGFSDAVSLQPDEANGLYATKASSAESLTNNLVNICNKIFQRDAIALTNGHFSSDVSLNTVVAFAQGESASISSLTSSEGENIDKVNNIDLHAGTFGAGGYNFKKANVSGQVVSFGSCAEGEYDLDYTGNNIQAFYEPNVEVSVRLKDENGNDIDTSEGVYPGDYIVEYGLVDGVTGEDVSNSDMLSPVVIGATVENNGNSTEISSGDKIRLDADSDTFIHVDGTFLDKYSFSTNRDDPSSIGHIPVNLPAEKELDVKVSTKQKGNLFSTMFGLNILGMGYDSWKPIRVDVSYDGEKLSDAQMNELSLSLEPSASEEMQYDYQIIPGESAYEITLGKDIEKGKYQISAVGTMKDEYDRKISDSDQMPFRVGTCPFGLWLLIIIILILIALAIILTRPAWPGYVRRGIDGGHPSPIRVGTTMRISDNPNFTISCVAKKKSLVWNKLMGGGSFEIRSITMYPINNCTVNGTNVNAQNCTDLHILMKGHPIVRCTDNYGQQHSINLSIK